MTIVLVGPHLKKVLYVRSTKKNSFGKILWSVSEKQKINKCFQKKKKLKKEGCWSWSTGGGLVAATTAVVIWWDLPGLPNGSNGNCGSTRWFWWSPQVLPDKSSGYRRATKWIWQLPIGPPNRLVATATTGQVATKPSYTFFLIFLIF